MTEVFQDMRMLAKNIYWLLRSLYRSTWYYQKIYNHRHVESFYRSLKQLHFTQKGASQQEKQLFFKEQLACVEIETHSFCNRICAFCPNLHVNRLDKKQTMPESVFSKIIGELSSIGYRGMIRLHRYNEPLGLDLIFDRVYEARKQLPYAKIGFYSNGDYVTKEKLEQLEKYGLDFIMICRYLSFSGNRRGQYLYAKKQCEDYIEKIGLKAREAYNYDNDIVRYVIPLGRMNVSVFVRDFQKCGVDRGGVLKDFSKTIRISPCASSFKQLSIDWTGDVLSCCNLRGDMETHKPYILGNAATETIQNIFYSETANKLRGQLAGFGEKYGPCRTCDFQVFKYDTRVDDMMRKALNNAGFYSDK